MAYMGYMDLPVRSLKKTVTLNHSLTQSHTEMAEVIKMYPSS